MKRQEVLDILTGQRDELYQMGVKSLSLFGSVARDEAREDSDIDLIIEVRRPMGLFGLIRIQQYLEQIFTGKKIDLVMRDAIYEELKEDILRESIRAA